MTSTYPRPSRPPEGRRPPARLAASAAARLASCAALLLAALLVPALAQAQLCFGSPNAQGQFSMQANVAFFDRGTGYTVGSLANLDGPWAMGASLGMVDMDVGDRQTVAAARGLWERSFAAFDACPVLEVEWHTSTGDADVDTWAFPLGVSAGTLFALSPTVEVIPSGRAGVRHLRTSVGNETFTDTGLFLDGGATFSFVPFFARGEILVFTGDQSETAFRISAGVTF